MVMPRPMPLWVTEPVELRCQLCRARDLNGEAPILAFMEPVDPETDVKWTYILIRRPLRIGQRDSDRLSGERTRRWRASGKLTVHDPGPLFDEGRTRLADIATIDVVRQTVGGGDWTAPPDLTCPKCDHQPRKWPVGVVVAEVRKIALNKSSGRTIYI